MDEPIVAWVDTAFGVGGLLTLAAGTTAEDRTAFVNWMCPLTFGTAGVAALALPRRQAAVATAVLGATYAATVTSSLRSGGSVLATGVANTLSYAGYFVCADLFVARLRRSALELETARRAAVERGERLATERERNVQHRLLHDSALQTLEVVAKGWTNADGDAVRAQARREVTRLREALRGGLPASDGLGTVLRALADEFSASGLNVELLLAELDREPDETAITLLTDAVNEALANVLHHADVTRAVVRVVSNTQNVEVTVRDHGRGFDPDPMRTVGLPDSLLDQLSTVGGTAEVRSQAGRGTLVTVRVPT